MSDLSDQAQPRCKVILEDWHPEVEAAIWADPSPDALRTGIDALAELLTSLVDRPDDVTLVLPVDVSQAVLRRDPSVHDAVERGAGNVGGRTMLRKDGRVEVIVDSNSLINADSSGFKPTAAGLPRSSQTACRCFAAPSPTKRSTRSWSCKGPGWSLTDIS